MRRINRVKDTSNSTGAGSIILNQEVIPGFRDFGDYLATDYFPYTLVASDGGFEIGIGQYNPANQTLTRFKILDSSNANNEIVLPAGTHEIWIGETKFDFELWGYTVKISVPQSVSSGVYTNVIWNQVVDDPLGLITAALPTADLTVPDWIDRIQVVMSTQWQNLQSPAGTENFQTRIRDLGDTDFAPSLRHIDTADSGTSGPTYSVAGVPMNPQTVNGRGVRAAVRHVTGGTAEITQNTAVHIRFVQ